VPAATPGVTVVDDWHGMGQRTTGSGTVRFGLRGDRRPRHQQRRGAGPFWRNVRTHALHDPVAYKRREVGDHFLNGTHPPFTLYT
jgi:hypothetical protein